MKPRVLNFLDGEANVAEELEIPEFLKRKPGEPPQMPDEQIHAIWKLSEEQAELVWKWLEERSIKFPKKTAIPKGEDRKKALILALLKARMDQADVIMAMVRDSSVQGVKTIEDIVGKPITRLQEKAHRASEKKKEKAAGARAARSRKSVAFEATDTIHLLVKENPKKKGGAPYERFEKYKEGMTVGDALAAGVFEADIQWDVGHKFIELKGA